MRGKAKSQVSMVALVSVEGMVPDDHPLRGVKRLADEALKALSPEFEAMYSASGRPSVPPERLLKATLLLALFSVRSERQLCEQIRYNMLFRWFLDMDLSETPFDVTVFTKNRQRLMEHEVAPKFLRQVVELARARGLLSPDHFSVDGTLIEAWASMKSFRPKDGDDGDNNGFGDFSGTKRSNDTHESKTDPDAKLMRKGRGKEAKLAYMAHLMTENRNGLIVDMRTTQANGTAERDAAADMIAAERKSHRARKPRRITVAADKGYDAREFIVRLRKLRATPHVARRKHSILDERTTRHAGYAVSAVARRLIEKAIGWVKGIAGLRRTRFRGRDRTDFYGHIAAAAFDLIRISHLSESPV